MTNTFDFNQAIEKLKSGKGLLSEDGILTPLIKQLTGSFDFCVGKLYNS